MRVARDVVALSRSRWRPLAAAGLAVFIPVGLIDSFHLTEVEIGGYHGAASLAVFAVVFAASASTLLGAVFYSGAVTAIATEDEGGEHLTLREIARRLPYVRLIVADILLIGVVGVGLLLLVIPGLLFIVWFSLAGPLIEAEGLGVAEAMRHSRRLVSRQFWPVASIVLPLAVLTNALAEGVFALVTALLGDAFLPRWAGATLAELVTEQLFALALVVIYLELSGRERPG